MQQLGWISRELYRDQWWPGAGTGGEGWGIDYKEEAQGNFELVTETFYILSW